MLVEYLFIGLLRGDSDLPKGPVFSVRAFGKPKVLLAPPVWLVSRRLLLGSKLEVQQQVVGIVRVLHTKQFLIRP